VRSKIVRVVAVPVLVAASLALADAASAQDACKFDTAALTKNVPVILGLAPGQPRHHAAAAPDDYALAAQAVQLHLTPPGKVTLPLWARTASPEPSPAVRPEVLRYGLHSDVIFRLNASGHLADSTISINTASPELNASLVAAIKAADAANDFSPPSDAVRDDSGTIALRLVDWTHTGVGLPLVRLSIPAIRVDSSAQMISHPTPATPTITVPQEVVDTVVLLHVVTALGQADPKTFRVVSGGYREFIVSAMEAAVHSQYTPARIHSCAVPQEVVGWDAFQIAPSAAADTSH
jgi:hypothetical protein